MAIKTIKSTKAVAAKAKAAPVVNVVPPTTEEIHLLISQRAYELFLQRGASPGSEVNDWLSAEQEILGAFCTPAPASVVEFTLVAEPVVEKAPAKAKRTVRPKPVAATATTKRSTASTRTRRKSAPETPKG
jgi:hypothetical protein